MLRLYRDTAPIMENQTVKNMENPMETGGLTGYVQGLLVSVRSPSSEAQDSCWLLTWNEGMEKEVETTISYIYISYHIIGEYRMATTGIPMQNHERFDSHKC